MSCNNCQYEAFFFFIFQVCIEIKKIKNYVNPLIKVLNNIIEEISCLDIFKRKNVNGKYKKI